MTLVMGQRSRLSWDIPAADSFLLNQAIYQISEADYQRTLKELDALLDLGPILKKPVRNLSLGERMKVELAAGLLHRPTILFLDEPTIGLDITAQAHIRTFLQEYNRLTGATILLTSHYMADVTALCERILIIDKGRLKYDGGLTDLSRRIAPFKLIGITLGEPCPCDLTPYGIPVESDSGNGENSDGDAPGGKQYIRVDAAQVTSVTARLLAELPIHDLTIADPPIEDVIERAFQE
jgi:ABC-2 type transport system ATP-binding protein